VVAATVGLNALPYSDAAKRSVAATTLSLMPKSCLAKPTMTSALPDQTLCELPRLDKWRTDIQSIFSMFSRLRSGPKTALFF
jgi:hypothetical protein